MNRKIKNRVKKAVEAYDELFDGPLNVKDNVVTSEFFYLYVDEDAVTYLAPCLNENYSTFLCMYLLRLTEKNVTPLRILEGYMIDSENNKLIPERELADDEDEDSPSSAKLLSKIPLSSDIEVVSGYGLDDIIIRYKDDLLSKPNTEDGNV